MADGITLARNGTSITLTEQLEVQRSCGRPNSELRGVPISVADRPKYLDKPRSATDEFDISGVFLSGTPEADARTLQEDILLPPLGRESLTLTFDNNLYSLGSREVVPEGSRAGRITYSAGETGIVRVTALTLREVDNSA